MDLTHKKLNQIENGRRRGWIIYLLYSAAPMPVDFNTLLELLDARNFPLSCRRFAEKMDFLRGAGLLRVFPMGSETELTNVDQAKLIQRYCDNDGEGGHGLLATLTSKGVNFQEGHFEETGVTRIN